MTEDTAKVEKADTGLSRRDFIKKTAIIGAGTMMVASGLGVARKEIGVLEKGVETDSGVFFPLYEHHEIGITPEKIPPDMDVLFREAYSSRMFQGSPKYRLLQEGSSYIKNTKIRIFTDEILKKIAFINALIMLGDVNPSLGDWTRVGIAGGEFVGGLAIIAKLLKDQFKSKKTTSNSGSYLTRRKFIKAAAGLGAAWLMTPGGYFLSRGGLEWNKNRDEALDRIMDRLYGIQSSLHPEDSLMFFRNLMMADKMLTVAEDVQKRTGRKTKMGFQVEYGHNGIEDFLKMGHGFCKAFVLSYPNHILDGIIKANNGIEDFASARLFKFPADFNIGNPNWDNVEDIKITDVDLKKKLELKLGA